MRGLWAGVTLEIVTLGAARTPPRDATVTRRAQALRSGSGGCSRSRPRATPALDTALETAHGGSHNDKWNSYSCQPRCQTRTKNKAGRWQVPYTGSLPTALGPGRTVLVKGEINKYPKSFNIDLKMSGTKNIALHLNPRMKEKAFVRNTFLYDSWGEEERQLWEFPFFPEMFFELLIYCEAHCFKVAINGKHMLEYKHRFKDLSKINEISVGGDIQLYDLRVW